MRDALRKMRHFLMKAKGLSEDEAISLMSVAVDFGVTQWWTPIGHPRDPEEGNFRCRPRTTRVVKHVGCAADRER
jgi:hypothetical protein